MFSSLTCKLISLCSHINSPPSHNYILIFLDASFFSLTLLHPFPVKCTLIICLLYSYYLVSRSFFILCTKYLELIPNEVIFVHILSLKIGEFRCNSVLGVYIVSCHTFHFEVFAHLGYFTVEIGTFLPAFWESMLVPSFRVSISKNNGRAGVYMNM